MSNRCERCGEALAGRRFSRSSDRDRAFCSILCVAAYEVSSGLPRERIYEARPGWSSFPVAPPDAAARPS